MALHPGCPDNSRVSITSQHWRRALPVLSGGAVTLREVTATDALSLTSHLNRTEVTQHMAPPPTSVESFRRFVRWTRAQRRAGTHLCFAVVPHGQTSAVGIVQIWRLEPDFTTAEWGIAIGDTWWGRGLAHDAARALFAFAFDTLGVVRIEARIATTNVRAHRLMERLGATREGTLRHSVRRGATFADQALWAVFADDRANGPAIERAAC